ncbi:DUF3237 domain-containing protein [Bradyrhizobium sp. B120]|uniref:DUF3237 domain-containing protein n=1 Tax=Bradyrhizobium sp. B120 TaxID=3410088 RepID=UPI003B97E2C7
MSNSTLDQQLVASLVPLCLVRATLGDRVVLPAPFGTRAILEVETMRYSGDRLNASLRGRAAADWVTVSSDGRLGAADARCTMETDDGALIFVQYNGRIQYALDGGPHRLYVAPRFETEDVRYAWLNAVQAVGKGLFDPQSRILSYAFFQLS